jgi:hypothetical protein
VDYEFTARMEDALDAISRGEEDWVPLMHQFWNRFEKEVREKDATVTRDQVAQAPRARRRSREPQAGERADGPLRTLHPDRHARRRGRSRASRACVPDSA